MDGPKPQRQRKAKKSKEQPKVEIKVTKPKTPRRKRETVVVETTQGGRRFNVTENTRHLRKLQKEVNKLKKNEAGPQVQSVFDTKLTLGTLQGVSQEDLDRQMRVWLSPVLLKPRDATSTSTPLTIRGSQYNLYKILQASVILTPLVGKANVAGTIILVDLDQDSSAAKPDTIDSVKARAHVEVHLGQQRRWNIPKRQLVGPRDGWWYTDTSESPTQAMGPALNFWTYLSTMNLLGTVQEAGRVSTTAYTGPLFLAEVHVKFAFSNYNPKSALAHLYTAHVETRQAGKLINGDNEEIILEVPRELSSNLFVREEPGTVAKVGKDKSDIVTSVVSTTVEAVAGALGPWGWLLRGGWFLVRRIFKLPERVLETRDSTLNTYYSVYSSVQDAMRDQPIRGNVGSQGVSLQSGFYNTTQVNTPDLEDVYNSPEVRLVPSQYTHDYLPLALAALPESIPPPFYTYSPENGYIPGRRGQPEQDGLWSDWDSKIQFAGPEEVYWMTLSKSIEMDWEARPNQPPWAGTQGWWYTLSGKSWAFYNYTNTGVMIGEREDQKDYGAMHTTSSLMRSLQIAGQNLNKKDKGRPWQLFQKLWDCTSPDTGTFEELKKLLHLIYTKGEDAWIFPACVDSGLGWSRIYIHATAGTTLPGDSPVDHTNMRAQGVFIINLSSSRAGLIVASNDDKSSFQSKLLRENTMTCHNCGGNTSKPPMPIIEWPLPNRSDSEITLVDEEEDFVAVRRNRFQ
nr:MAG: capsid protein [Avian astrovirus 12]